MRPIRFPLSAPEHGDVAQRPGPRLSIWFVRVRLPSSPPKPGWDDPSNQVPRVLAGRGCPYRNSVGARIPVLFLARSSMAERPLDCRENAVRFRSANPVCTVPLAAQDTRFSAEETRALWAEWPIQIPHRAPHPFVFWRIAQTVEPSTDNREVPGSTPGTPTSFCIRPLIGLGHPIFNRRNTGSSPVGCARQTSRHLARMSNGETPTLQVGMSRFDSCAGYHFFVRAPGRSRASYAQRGRFNSGTHDHIKITRAWPSAEASGFHPDQAG